MFCVKIIYFCFAAAFTLFAQSPLPSRLQNGSFEEGVPGMAPKGWMVSSQLETKAEIREGNAIDGRQSAVVWGAKAPSDIRSPYIMQNIDATLYRGKRVCLRAKLKVENLEDGKNGCGQLWLQVNRPDWRPGFFDNMNNRPVRTEAWTSVEIIGDVAEDSETLAIGAMLTDGGGLLWVDAVTLEVLGKTPAMQGEAPRPLSKIGLNNLTAFAKSLGYVRFFHPSDEAVNADWDRLARKGVRELEGAVNVKDLANRLNYFFAPYAPSIKFSVKPIFLAQQKAPKKANRVVRWKHLGAGFTRLNGYRSIREYATFVNQSNNWPDPSRPISRDLGRGLQIHFSTTCYVDESGNTLPKALRCNHSPKKGNAAMPDTTVARINPYDRATRIAAAVQVWSIVQHFYPNFDLREIDWPKALEVTLLELAKDGSPEGYLHTMRQMMASLGDGHGTVSPLWDMQEGRPGLELVWVGNDLVISGFEPGFSGQLRIGDILVSVDGVPVDKLVKNLAPTIPSSTIQGLKCLEAQMLLEGVPKPLNLIVRGADGVARLVKITRDGRKKNTLSEPRPISPVAELKSDIWYVDLTRLNNDFMPNLLPKLTKARVIIVDVRGYPASGAWKDLFSHLTNEPLESPPFLVPTPVLPDQEAMTFQRTSWNIKPKAPLLKALCIFLTDARAISQAELLLSFVEQYRLGKIVGGPTAGTNGNINPFETGGLWIRWTGMKVSKHDGSPLNGVGILPTVCVSRTLSGIREGRDEILEKAMEMAIR